MSDERVELWLNRQITMSSHRRNYIGKEAVQEDEGDVSTSIK